MFSYQTNPTGSHVINNDLPLKIGTLNVCGIMNRIHYPEFTSLAHRFDLLCYTECKSDDHDTVSVDCYYFLGEARKQKCLKNLVVLVFSLKMAYSILLKLLNQIQIMSCG